MLPGGDAGDATRGGCGQCYMRGFTGRIPLRGTPFHPTPCSSHRGSPRGVLSHPGTSSPAACSAWWHRGQALGHSSGGLGAPVEDLRVPEPLKGFQSPALLQARPPVTSLTVTLHPLVNEPIQQRPAVVTEGGAGVRVDFKFVFAPGILGGK